MWSVDVFIEQPDVRQDPWNSDLSEGSAVASPPLENGKRGCFSSMEMGKLMALALSCGFPKPAAGWFLYFFTIPFMLAPRLLL